MTGGGVGVLLAGLAAMAGVARAQVPGDADCDGVASDADLVAVMAAISGDAPGQCLTRDVNADGRVSAADVVALVQILVPATVGPTVTFFGLASPDGRAVSALGSTDGVPVFYRSSSSGFLIVVEGRAGASGGLPGLTTFEPDGGDPTRRPDVQIESERGLGDGSAAVCEGGVPGIDPPSFGPTVSVADALNDFGCHFEAASGGSPCTQDEFGRPRFLGTGTQAQFCMLVPRSLEFPAGDTLLTVRLRDVAGNLGPVGQMTLRVGSGPVPPTFTATPVIRATETPTPTSTLPPSPTPSRTPSFTATALRTPTRTATVLPSATPTPTLVRSATPSPIGSRVPTGTPSATPPPSASPTRTWTATPRSPTATLPSTVSPSPTATSIRTATPRGTASATRTRTATAMAPPTATRTPTRTATPLAPSATPTLRPSSTRTASPTPSLRPTATRTATFTRTPSRTPTRSPSPSPTIAGVIGPVITFFGLTRADDTLIDPSGTTPDGLPIYTRPASTGFSLVVEGKPGLSRATVGRSAFQPDGQSFPDLQVEVSRPLGDGSTAVCDNSGAMVGGVPAVDPVSFDPIQSTIDAVNDFACRFLDGGGSPNGRSSADACVLFPSGDFLFVASGTTVQFCGFIDRPVQFPTGDTVVTARLRDTAGNVGAQAQIVVRTGS